MNALEYAASPQLADHLEELAWWVADALDSGNVAGAWDLTRALEELAGEACDGRQPPIPVIARRFARAHRLLLSGENDGAVEAAARLRARPPEPAPVTITVPSVVPTAPVT